MLQEWVGVVELLPLPPVDAEPSIDQLLKLKDHTNSALAQFEQRREAHVSGRVSAASTSREVRRRLASVFRQRGLMEEP